MDNLIQILILSLVQGITEFLPISSSAHMLLVDMLFPSSINDQLFMVVSHAGTLVSVVWYFRSDVIDITKNFLKDPINLANPEVKLAWNIVISTIPVVIFGAIFGSAIEENFYNIRSIAINTIVFGFFLGYAAFYASKHRTTESMLSLTWQAALIIGIFQAIALFPGVSRSGITMSACLIMGLYMVSATKYALLISIPVMAGAISLMLFKTNFSSFSSVHLISFLASLISSYITLVLFFAMIKRIGITSFVIYRILLGVALLILSFL